MGDYYNKTQGPLPVTLHGGKSCSIPPKTWFFIEPANENSASIVAEIRKGHLVRSAVGRTFSDDDKAALMKAHLAETAPKAEPQIAEAEPKIVPSAKVAAKAKATEPQSISTAVTSALKEETPQEKR